jgi:hypothetical protein
MEERVEEVGEERVEEEGAGELGRRSTMHRL